MCHIRNRLEVLADCHRVLRPRGRMLFTDAMIVTGLVSQDELALRSSISAEGACRVTAIWRRRQPSVFAAYPAQTARTSRASETTHRVCALRSRARRRAAPGPLKGSDGRGLGPVPTNRDVELQRYAYK